jgi:hypothetical protein
MASVELARASATLRADGRTTDADTLAIRLAETLERLHRA